MSEGGGGKQGVSGGTPGEFGGAGGKQLVSGGTRGGFGGVGGARG